MEVDNNVFLMFDSYKNLHYLNQQTIQFLIKFLGNVASLQLLVCPNFISDSDEILLLPQGRGKKIKKIK